ncbi:hypothetical protein D3C73_1537880 [compost metagenome]
MGERLGAAFDVRLIGKLAAADQGVIQAQQQYLDIQLAQVVAVFQVQVRHGTGSRRWGKRQPTPVPYPRKGGYPQRSGPSANPRQR